MPLLRLMAGPLLFLGLLVSVSNELFSFAPSWLASGAVWAAGLILFLGLAKPQQRTVGLIALLALFSWLIAWQTGPQYHHLLDALSVNQSMIVMLIAVQFLQLVALPKGDKQEISPIGKQAFFKTYLGIHFFGSVINLSALLLVADRLITKPPVLKNQHKLLIRGFTSGASWSPFFAAFAASLVFTPNATLSVVIVGGFLLSIAAFLLTWQEVSADKEDLIDDFVGYPMHFEALWLPIVLVFLVFSTQYFSSSTKVITLIAIYALLISVLVLLVRKGIKTASGQLKTHVLDKLPQMKNELTLFLIAGVLGGGIATAMDSLQIAIPISHFDGLTASGIMLCVLLLAIVGIHPIISIAVVGHWMIGFGANHTLLAMMFLMSWAIGVAISPVSGVNLAMQGRYGLSGRAVFRWNLPYAIKMYFVASAILISVSYLLGV